MFPSKRCRSPEEDVSALKKNKIETETTDDHEESNKSITKSTMKNTQHSKENISDNVKNEDNNDFTQEHPENVSNKCDVAMNQNVVTEAPKRVLRVVVERYVEGKSSKTTHSNINKKENNKNNINTPKTKASNSNKKNPDDIPENEKCNDCGQFLNNSDIKYYQGHPQNAVEESVALTYDKLILSAGDEGDIMERPHTNITGFSIFDQHEHLCAIDSGLVENDGRIFMSGYLKSICSDSPDIVDEDSVPVKDVGPIIEWYITGFDGGRRNYITLSTEFGEYNLVKPSTEYTPLMYNFYEKVWLCKLVVEYLEEYNYMDPTYEDLLKVITEPTISDLGNNKLTEEILHKHAEFLCDQIVSLETKEDDEPLITLRCMRELVNLIGIKFGKRKAHAKIDYKKVDKKAWTKATTTPLVRKTFESFFAHELDKTDECVWRRKRCGICEACQLPDCGVCTACRAMAKFGGHGRSKEACVRRLCPNTAVQEADDNEPEDDDYGHLREVVEDKENEKPEKPVDFKAETNRNIQWVGAHTKADETRVYYEKVKIDGSLFQVGDYVMVETALPNIPSLVTKIIYMWKEVSKPKLGYFHGQVFIRPSETVLGEVGNAREVFAYEKCCHGAPLAAILRKACVEKKETPSDWFKLGGKEVCEDNLEDDGKTYYYQKFYERFTARFTDIPEDPPCPNELRKHRYCPSCERKTKRDIRIIPRVFGELDEKSECIKESYASEWSFIKWQDYEYKKGQGVFLRPRTFRFKKHLNNDSNNNRTKKKLKKVDEDMYPEYYRKSHNSLRGSNIDTGKPFCVGYIVAVVVKGESGVLIPPQAMYLKVNVLYRPENTTSRFPQHEDLNVVYWSNDIVEVPFSAVLGPCQLFYEKNIPADDIHEWLEKDPTRVYFRKAYNVKTGKFVDVPQEATYVGRTDKGIDKGKGKGKGKGKSSKPQEVQHAKVEEKNVMPLPLKTLDVFAGCGGLSEGLHRAGVADCRWAVENEEAAAHAYAMNNKKCLVFNEDCNALLEEVMSGATHSAAGLRLPTQGEVELLCGGPPCQGFSGMNRFNSREYSNFKNSLVVSYLSYCDYYRPKYFILENVRNFAVFKKGMVLKLTMKALLDMGYQCTFGVLQAGSYGVPQTRRRLIILAAAPGYKLPLYPEPTHVFSKRACSLTTAIDGKRFTTNIWRSSGPRRTCTIHDAMSDLPEILNGANETEIEYASMPESHFQRMMRPKDESAKLRDHICKNMAPLIQARIFRIPTTPGSDWRDLPNISVTLSDGSKCKVLQYLYEDKKNGRSSTGAMRGVCSCAAGGPCQPGAKQENTLIPWCLPHTANRHGHWAGLYGRLDWTGYFSTTVTDPEPMGKQGRVLHPTQHRVVSVRECARSQGFPDTYHFAGSIQDKHRQIGNAVPPPLAMALGREILKSLAESPDA